MELFPVRAESFKLDGGAMFGVVPATIWRKFFPPDTNNMIPIACRCLLISDGDRLIMIDAGIGNKQDEKFKSFLYQFEDSRLEEDIVAAGFSLNMVTDVLLTHLHWDHCGGLFYRIEGKDDFAPLFPNASIWCTASQWDWANKPNSREKPSFLIENLKPMDESGKLKLIRDEKGLGDNIEFHIVHGHTEGQLVPIINTGKRKVAFMGDFFPTQAHVPVPYVPSYDTRPLVSMKEKQSFLEKAVSENIILFFEHDYSTECCTVHSTEKGVRVLNSGSLMQMLCKE